MEAGGFDGYQRPDGSPVTECTSNRTKGNLADVEQPEAVGTPVCTSTESEFFPEHMPLSHSQRWD